MALAIPTLRGALNSPAAPQAVLKMRTTLLMANIGLLSLFNLPFSSGSPLIRSVLIAEGSPDSPKDAKDASLWVYLGTALALVLLGGVFAGLTIALMGQDEIYLQVIATSGEGAEKKHAKKVLNLLRRGKHWVLVTLLLSNVITNETLPIVLDRSLGGGWPAVLGSTVLIVIFGEIAPQSVCVRYGLPIGAWMAPFVLVLMWILSPVAWPTAKLLDYLLGEDHGTTYKKAGLKTLVTLHKTLGTSPNERLNEDEVTIISAVLDLKEKPVGRIMTPMGDVFTLSADAVLDEDMMDTILSAGYSRIPIYAPDNPKNFVGMLLVKMLITYDPEDSLSVRDFSLATLPETRPETSCLDIVNFFQEGKSHMVLISDFPGQPYGALGVLTLEDVIEELIGEEIVDESDVFVDVHKAIRRMHPAPRLRVPKGTIVTDPEPGTETHEEGELDNASKAGGSRKPSVELARSPQAATFLLRRRSSGQGNAERSTVRGSSQEMREHLKHLGPSNVASRPKSTRINTVKIKPGVGTIPEAAAVRHTSDAPQPTIMLSSSLPKAPQGGMGEGLLSGGKDASDGVQAVHQGYGTMSSFGTAISPTQRNERQRPTSRNSDRSPRHQSEADDQREPRESPRTSPRRSHSGSTIGSLRERSPKQQPVKRMSARSGSITENFVDTGGMKKMVLETTSSSDTEEGLAQSKTQSSLSLGPTSPTSTESQEEKSAPNGGKQREDGLHGERNGADGGEARGESADKKKKRKKRGKKKKGGDSGTGKSPESEQPLLGDGSG